MRKRSTFVVGLGVMAAVSACSDQSTEPSLPEVSAAATSTNLVDGFTFLPPLAENQQRVGDFNPNLLPSVEICEYVTTAPATPDAATCLHPDTGASADPLVLSAVVDDDLYIAEWNTDKDASGNYRVFATLPSGELGYVDVVLASGGGAKKKNGETVDATVANAGRTIPVKFHISNEGRISGFNPDITDPDCEDCDTWTVPVSGGLFTLGTPVLAGIQFPPNWSDIPRDLLIACNDGEFCLDGNCSGPLDDGPFPPGEGPLDSGQDPTVVAEWPLFCELKLDPAFGPGEYFGNPPTTDPNSAVLAQVGVCQVDDANDPDQEDLHPFIDHTPLEMGRREGGVFDRTGNTSDINFDLTAPPPFLTACVGVSAPIVMNPAQGLRVPGFIGELAAAFGEFVAPDPLWASSALVRDGGIGATLGSLGTIFGAVEIGQGPPPTDVQSEFGTADIDGVNDSNDAWDNFAATVDLSNAGAPLSGATLYVMNSGSQLYLGLDLGNFTLDNADVVDFRFDNGPIPDGDEDFQDDQAYSFVSSSILEYQDSHFDSGWFNDDVTAGGSQNGAAAYTSFFELRKPLFSEDNYDFLLDAGEEDQVGLCLVVTDDFGEGFDQADYPVGCSTGTADFLIIKLRDPGSVIG